MPPWNDWYHVTGNTYGTWLPGDSRGWRTRHHRTHIDLPEGIPTEDQPLPETGLSRQSRRDMTRPPVRLTPVARALARDTILAALSFHKIEVIILAVTDHHFHILARFRDRKPRKWAGIAKKESARALSRAYIVDPGGVWAVRTHCKPIADRAHQLLVVQYIADHAAQGAAIWRFDASIPRTPND